MGGRVVDGLVGIGRGLKGIGVFIELLFIEKEVKGSCSRNPKPLVDRAFDRFDLSNVP